jgi:hypothetical protein
VGGRKKNKKKKKKSQHTRGQYLEEVPAWSAKGPKDWRIGLQRGLHITYAGQIAFV